MQVARIAITDDSQVMRCRLLMHLIRLCGAEPVLIPIYLKPAASEEVLMADQLKTALEQHQEEVRALLSTCDGIILPGNKFDIPPVAYGDNTLHPETEKRLPVDPLFVRFETEAVMAQYGLFERPLPLLGICGGMQVVNVTLGGTLVQHLPDNSQVMQYGMTHRDEVAVSYTEEEQRKWEACYINHIRHGLTVPRYPASHPMEVKKGSLLGDMYLRADPAVNLQAIGELSIHHQGMFEANLAEGVVPVAMAPDGVVEAAEYAPHPAFCLLTQFHPECNVSNIALALVEGVVQAAGSKGFRI